MNMTDVTVAPEGGAPPAEVEINQNPVSTSNPVGDQAPEKPPVEQKSEPKSEPKSRREAIREAFERANNPKPKEAKEAPKEPPKAADAKPGHNKPPEETEGLDLKKRPA